MARGTIIKRKKKSGGFTFDIKYRTSDGTQIKRAIGPGRAEAEEALAAAIAAVNRGELRSTSRITFAEAADSWLAAKRPRLEPSTYRDYEIHLRKRLKPAFGTLRLRHVTRARIETYMADQDAMGELS